MNVSTTRFGTIEIQEEQVIRMPSGIIGFPGFNRYVLLEHKKGSPFLWFQSLDNEALAFVVIDPVLFKPDYKIEIHPEDRLSLELQNGGDELQTLAIVSISNRNKDGKPMEVTANLLGPIVVNLQKRLAKQVVLDEQRYSHRHPIPLTQR